MKAHNWFILGLCILAATFFHALSSQSFQVLHYVFIALGTFFIVGAFISGGGSIKTGDEARDPKEIGSKSIFKIKTLAYVLLICISRPRSSFFFFLVFFFFFWRLFFFPPRGGWLCFFLPPRKDPPPHFSSDPRGGEKKSPPR